MSEETKDVLGIAGAFLLGLLFVSAASVGKERAHYDYDRGYAAAVDSVQAVEQKATRPHLIDLADVPYLVYVDRDSIVRVLRFGGHK